MIDPDKIALDPEQEQKRAERIVRKQQRLHAEAFEPVKNVLDRAYSLGVVVVGDAPIEVIADGVKATYPSEDMLWLDWEKVHDPDLDKSEAEFLIEQVEGLQGKSGNRGLIVIENTDFSTQAQTLANPLGTHLVEMCVGQDKLPTYQRYEPRVLAVGHGAHENLTYNPEFTTNQYRRGGVAEQLACRLGLLPQGTFQAWTPFIAAEADSVPTLVHAPRSVGGPR